MVKRSLKDHLTVFIISVTLFSMGLMIGLTSSKMQSNDIELRINEFEKNLNSLEVGFLLSSAIKNKTISCNYLQAKIIQIKEQIRAVGEAVIRYEEQAKIKDPDYLLLKKQYTYVRAQYWIMLERLKNECSTNYTVILYFYRTKEPCPECRDQGVVLSHLEGLNDDLYVVPVDSDEDLLIIETLKKAFNITKAPSLVINSQTRLEGLILEDELIDYLYNQSAKMEALSAQSLVNQSSLESH